MKEKKISSVEMTSKILDIQKDLEEFAALIDEKVPPEDGSKTNHLHVQIQITVFDGSWMGEIMPSLMNFPFGTVVLKRGLHAKTLIDLLDEMKKKSSEQLENLKKDLVDSLKV